MKRKTKEQITLVGDFESRNYPIPEYDTDVSVWYWAFVEVGAESNYKEGKTIDTFVEAMGNLSKEKKIKIYFHNLAFDGWFILYFLLSSGYRWIDTDKEDKLNKHECCGIVSKEGVWYALAWNSGDGPIVCKDSLKLINYSVEQMAKDFGLGETKGRIDYDMFRPYGYEPTEEERSYIKRDVGIVAKSIAKFRAMTDCESDTIAGCALEWFTREILGKGDAKEGRKKRDELFPHIDREVFNWIKKAYHGGYCYVSEKMKGQNKPLKHMESKDVKEYIRKNYRNQFDKIYKDRMTGTVLDVNSLYPSVMRAKGNIYPYGKPMIVKGGYNKLPEEIRKKYPVYFIRVTCSFDIKPGKLPTVQIKDDIRFHPRDYLLTTDDETVCLTFFCRDYERFLNHYDVEDLEEIETVCFKGMSGEDLFGEYVDHWTELKTKGKKEKNAVMKTIAKLFLNSLYGRFAKAFYVANQNPVMVEGHIIMESTEERFQDTFSYLPVGAAVTSYAREVTLTACDAFGEFFIYSDTDSAHVSLPKEVIPVMFPAVKIDEYNLGEWKPESEFYLDDMNAYEGAKRYLESVTPEYYDDYTQTEIYLENGKENKRIINVDKWGRHWHIACAGLPSSCYREVINFIDKGENPIADGQLYRHKLQSRRVKGGCRLSESEYRMRQRFRFS